MVLTTPSLSYKRGHPDFYQPHASVSQIEALVEGWIRFTTQANSRRLVKWVGALSRINISRSPAGE